MQKDINFNCPNCKSNKYKSKTTMGKKYNEGPYKDVISDLGHEKDVKVDFFAS